MKNWRTVAAAIVTMTGCGANPHRTFHGPLVQPLWTMPGLGISQAPYLHEGIVYVFGHVPPARSSDRRLYAFDLATRKQLWISSFMPLDKIKYIDGQKLFVVDDQLVGHTLDRQTGRELEPPAPSKLQKAIVADGVIYATHADGLVTAGTLWTAHLPVKLNQWTGPVYAAGALYVFGENETRAAIYCLDAASGKIRWQHEQAGENRYTSQLEVSNNLVFATIHFNTQTSSRRNLVALDAATGKQLWTAETASRMVPDQPMLLDPSTLLLLDYPSTGRAVFESGFLIRAFNAKTGVELWQATTPYKRGPGSLYKGALYFADQEQHYSWGMWAYQNGGPKDSWLTKVDPRTGKEIWRSKVVENGDFTGVAFGEGLIVVGANNWPTKMQPTGLYVYAQ